MAEVQRRGGRQKSESLSKFINFRARPSLHDKVSESAKLEGRSISEEVEYRLNRSYDINSITADMFGSEDQKPLILALCNAVRLAGQWADDEKERLDECYAAVIAVVEGLSGKKVEQIRAEAEDFDRTAHRDAAYRSIALKSGIPLPKSVAEIMGR